MARAGRIFLASPVWVMWRDIAFFPRYRRGGRKGRDRRAGVLKIGDREKALGGCYPEDLLPQRGVSRHSVTLANDSESIVFRL